MSRICTDLVFPFKAAWWRQLNPRLFLIDKSTPLKFIRSSTISAKSLAIASWRTVSPYESWKTNHFNEGTPGAVRRITLEIVVRSPETLFTCYKTKDECVISFGACNKETHQANYKSY